MRRRICDKKAQLFNNGRILNIYIYSYTLYSVVKVRYIFDRNTSGILNIEKIQTVGKIKVFGRSVRAEQLQNISF
jgi:hypothetical protein